MKAHIKHMNFRDRLATYTNEAECWLWPGAVDPVSGYVPSIRADGTRTHAHKYAYELLVGPVPEGMVIDHLCRVRHCMNPRHLEAVPQTLNVRRGLLCQKTHCNFGHPLSGDNIKFSKEGWRACRKCANDRMRAARKADPERFRRYTEQRDKEKQRECQRRHWPERREKENAKRMERYRAAKLAATG